MNINIELFKKLIEEIQELSELENKPLEARMNKFNEEYGEFSAEIIKLFGYTQKDFIYDDLIKEGIDSLIVHLSIILKLCTSLNIDFNEFLSAGIEKNIKWREKIPQYKGKVNICECYQKYLKIPKYDRLICYNIYDLGLYVQTGMAIIKPHPHRHYTFKEFCDLKIYNKFTND